MFGGAQVLPAHSPAGSLMGRNAKDNENSTVPLDVVDRWIAAPGAVPLAARVYDVTPRRAELEFGITSAIANLPRTADCPDLPSKVRSDLRGPTFTTSLCGSDLRVYT